MLRIELLRAYAALFPFAAPCSPLGLASERGHRAELEEQFGALRDLAWLSKETRAMSYEVSLYSPHYDRLTLVRLLAEFQPDAGARTT